MAIEAVVTIDPATRRVMRWSCGANWQANYSGLVVASRIRWLWLACFHATAIESK